MERATLRIATYNVHKCRGLDHRVRPDRVARVLAELDADIVALQEVVSIESDAAEDNHARFLAEKFHYQWQFGENRRLGAGKYGNVVLSRFPIEFTKNYDLTWRGCERRGCLRADIRIAARCCICSMCISGRGIWSGATRDDCWCTDAFSRVPT